jgi:hypothetical protein
MRLGGDLLARFLGLGLVVGTALGCGGGAPLLHGAHALGPGMTTNSAGFSGVFTTGNLRDAVDAARASEPSTARRNELLAKEGTIVTALGPTIAPFLAMRLGLAGDNEIGVSYTGRLLRLDARHAFESGPWALSLGAGARGTWNQIDLGADPARPQVPAHAGSYGFDVPVLIGWRSDAGIVSVWGGPRGGLERIGSSSSQDSTLDLTHWHAGGVAGLAMGFRHIHVALELEASYHGIQGSFGSGKVEVHGLTLTPAGGLLFTF